MRKNFSLFINKYNPFLIENTRFLKLVVSIYPGVAAVWLAFFKDPIVESTKRAAHYLQGRPGTNLYTINLITLLYWILLVIWVFCYFSYVTNESSANRKATHEVRAAIFRCPNPNIYAEYRTFFKQIMKFIHQIEGDNTAKQNVNLHKILQHICLLTSTYINQNDDETIYGANFMIYFPTCLNDKLILKFRDNKDEWIHLEKTELDSFVGVLHLVPELVYKTPPVSAKSKRIVSQPTQPINGSISLPVVFAHDEEIDIEHTKNIPGAPRAAMSEQFLFSDVRDYSSYSHLGIPECINAKNYWEVKQTEIRSIYSFAIPFSWPELKSNNGDMLDIIGVLNIDSTKIDILGTDQEYHTTFNSLLYPILCQLGPYLKNYYDIYVKELNATFNIA